MMSNVRFPSEVMVVLIAPNVSEQMGGEAIKAFQIYQELSKVLPNCVQITHERNQSELVQRIDCKNVIFVKDTMLAKLIWRSVVFRWLLDIWFSWVAVRLAERTIRDMGLDEQPVILHQTEPNSPVLPRATSRCFINVFGPINGNIYWPSIFRGEEPLRQRLRRQLHAPMQFIHKHLFRTLAKADLIFAAGGERTVSSLVAGGAELSQIVECLDCGIRDELLRRDRAVHEGKNPRFIHFGRLVYHKGTHLAIKSIAKTKSRVCLDIVGKGPELENCMRLVDELGINDRVKFLGWYESHAQLLDALPRYRGFVLPSFEDANGIVVQEGMAIGLPGICLDWGGPQLLIRHEESGFLVEPRSEEYITDKIAGYLDDLAEDGTLAESLSLASREAALGWRWSSVVQRWLVDYQSMLPPEHQIIDQECSSLRSSSFLRV